ncbi:MAG: hypothetical protein P4L30_08285 [Candidatus Limnocylindrales bacterium]|nr:hypothetical protein [Candidatus Limnocylindrales bacterium]
MPRYQVEPFVDGSTLSIPTVSTTSSAFPGSGVAWPNVPPLAFAKKAWICPYGRPEAWLELPVVTMNVMTSPPLSVSDREISSLPFAWVPAQ